MFFQKVNDEQKRFWIDGNMYIISNAADIDHFNCKSKILEILDLKIKEKDGCEPSTFQGWRKDLIKSLKEFDKMYVKHAKATNPELVKIITQAMLPLSNLMESNRNFYNLKQLMAKQPDVPDFRFEALEERFVEHLTKLCEVFRDHGDLKEPFDIRQMLEILKTPDWKNIVPLQFYLQPLEDAIEAVVKELLDMHDRGPLQVKYTLKNNTELHQKVIKMVQMDVSAQWLAGNTLKQDQFKFMYECQKIIYNSALKDYFVGDKKQYERILKDVLPDLVAYKSMMVIRDIDDKKKADDLKAKQKELRKKELQGLMGEDDESAKKA